MTHASTQPTPSALAIQLGKAWMDAYTEDPEVPERSEQFAQMQELVDMHLQSDASSLDDLVEQAFRWVVDQDEGDAAVRFMHALLPHFETISQEDDSDQVRAAYLVAIPVIGEQEHASHLARHASEMKFEDDLSGNGIIPPGAKVSWLPRTVSIHEAGEWLADHRRALLVAGLDGAPLGDAIKPPSSKFGIDRAQLSMLIGVVVSPESEVDSAMSDPAFLYASADDFMDLSQGEDSTSEWAMGRRSSAVNAASDLMTAKVVARGLDGVVMEEPGTLTEALSTLVSWSLRVQQIEEAQVLGLTEQDLIARLENTTIEVSMDASSGVVSMAMPMGDHILGPFKTDLPWRSLPILMMGEAILKRSIAPTPESIHWHPTPQKMWEAVAGTSRKWRMH